jgi:hypothetical protein
MTDVPPDGYIQLDLLSDTDSLIETGMEYMEFAIDNWRRKPGNPDTIMIEGSGQIGGEVAEQASMMPPEALIYIGTTIYNIPMLEGAPAVGTAVFTFATDAPAYIVSAGAQLSVPGSAGPDIIFETLADIAALPGGGTVNVGIVASETGVDANDCYGDSELVEPYEGLSITVPAPTSLGTDDETAADYLNRLSETLTTQSPSPVVPDNFATIAANVPGVGRATAIDLLCPGTASNPLAIRDPNELYYFNGKTPPVGIPTTNLVNEPRCTTVAVTAEDGTAPTHALMQAVWNALDSQREINFLNYVVPPTYTSIDVRGQVRAYPGTGVTDQQAADAAEDSIRTWLSANEFGQIPDSQSGKSWSNDTTVRHDEAVDYANRPPGVWFTALIEMKKTSDSVWTGGDILLTGVAPLPIAGTINLVPFVVE